MKDFDFQKWMKSNRDRKKKDLSRFTIRSDKYDREDFQRLIREMQDFKVEREKLAESKAGELAYDVWQDLYLSFWKVDPDTLPPKDIRPSHLINRFVMEEAEKLSEHKELRMWTMGDDIGSALACTTIEEDLETLYDKLEEQINEAQGLDETYESWSKAQDEQRDLDELEKQWQEQDPEDREPIDWSEKQREMEERIKDLEKKMQEQGSALEESMKNARPDIRGVLRKAMQDASEQAESSSAFAESWGLEPGSLHRLPAEQRLDLAKRMNNPKFRKMADLFGPMKRLAMAQQRRRVNFAPEEIYDVELGNDIQRLLPAELAKFGIPEQELLFLKDFSEKRLLQYKMRGYEKVARGGIVYCHDGSGSMHGDREIWAKAVGLCLLHIARKQKRPFYAIQFGSPSQIRVDDFRDTQKISPESVIDFAEFFFGGGTDFMGPLNHALKILNEEHVKTGAVKSDIVFASDGQCGITPDWMETFKKEQKRLNFRVWGINIGGNTRDEPMFSICDGKVCSISSLGSGDQVRDIFGGI